MIQAINMAFKSIAGNKLRAFLTMLGIIIGVMALVVLVSLVGGATNTVTDAVSNLGTSNLTVTISDDKGAPLKLDTLTEWAQEDGIGQIAPSANASATVKSGADNGTITVYGATAFNMEVEGLELLLGRFLKSADVENHSYVCVVNETVATEVVGYLDCVGEEVSLNGVKYTIVGILEDSDSSLTAAFGSGSLVA